MLKPRLCVAVLLATLLFATKASAASVSLAWDANTEPDLAGYLVSYGTAPGQVSGSANVGMQTSWTFTAGVAGQTYYFRVQAYNSAGSRSAPSNEVSATIDNAAPTVGPSPFGFVDTPMNNAAGVTGSLAVTGWALDNALVTRVRIFRDPVAGEPSGALVYIGDGSFVDGARPDVAAVYRGLPASTRAGWGYLMLTNFLPNLGNGTFTLRAYAYDADGHSTLLGTKTITCTNSSSTTPFGAIDTPTPGQTVSGAVNNFGWVLSRGTRRADPPGGGTVQVVIDGVPVGSPGGWTKRSDLTALFPVAQYSGISRALGVYTFDSRTLSNGVHTIAWAVTDNQGGAAGIGSRYFTVANGTPVTAAAVASEFSVEGAASPVSRVVTPLVGRRGFDLTAPWRTYRPNATGVVVVQAEELDRIELYTGATSAALVTANGVQPLPVGAGLDADGIFRWQPGVAFVGAYDFAFSGPDGDRQVRIILNPKGSGRVGPQVVIDTPSPADSVSRTFGESFVVAGWAADLDADMDTGIDAIHVWAYPRTGDEPVFAGTATLGGARPDVGAIYGDRFRKSGYGIIVSGLAPGDYDVAVFAWSTVTQGFIPAKTVRVRVR